MTFLFPFLTHFPLLLSLQGQKFCIQISFCNKNRHFFQIHSSLSILVIDHPLPSPPSLPYTLALLLPSSIDLTIICSLISLFSVYLTFCLFSIRRPLIDCLLSIVLYTRTPTYTYMHARFTHIIFYFSFIFGFFDISSFIDNFLPHLPDFISKYSLIFDRSIQFRCWKLSFLNLKKSQSVCISAKRM